MQNAEMRNNAPIIQILSFETYPNPNKRKISNEAVMKAAFDIAVLNLERKNLLHSSEIKQLNV